MSEPKEKETKKETKTETKKHKGILSLSNEDLRALIKKDINSSEAYITQNIRPKWDYCHKRYLGILDVDEYRQEWQSDMTMNLGFAMVTGEVSQLVNGLYQPNSFFALKPHNEKSAPTLKALEKLFPVFANNIKLQNKLVWITTDSCVFGPGWAYSDWEKGEKKREYSEAAEGKDMVKSTTKRKKISQPTLTSYSPYDVIFDHEAEEIDKMRFGATKEWLVIDDIREDERYQGPDKEAFLAYIDRKDPRTKPTRIMAYRYWTKEIVVVITESEHMIRKQENKRGKIPLRCMIKNPLQREVIGIGTMEAVGDQLDYTDEIMNTAADSATLSTMPMFETNHSFSAEDEEMYPAKLWRLKHDEHFKRVEMGSTGYDYSQIIRHIDDYMNRVQGDQSQIEATGTDTATESRIIAARSNTKKQAFIDYNKETFMKWLIEDWIEMVADNMTPKEIAETIGEDDWKKLGIELDELKLKDIDYTIVITADNGLEDRMIAVQNANQALGTIASIAQLAQIPNLPIDFNIMLKHVLSKFDFPEGIYKEPEEMQAGAAVPVEQEIAEIEAGRGMVSGQLIEEIAAKEGLTIEQVKQQIAKAGSIESFAKSKQEERA